MIDSMKTAVHNIVQAMKDLENGVITKSEYQREIQRNNVVALQNLQKMETFAKKVEMMRGQEEKRA